MVSLATERNLLAKEFGQTCLALPEVHGLTWALRVFAMAGFKPEKFLEIAATSDSVVVQKVLTLSEKLEIIRLATETAKSCKMLRAGYMWEHPQFGRGVLHRSGVYVDTTVSLFKNGKVLVMGGCPSNSPMDKGWLKPTFTPVHIDPVNSIYVLNGADDSVRVDTKGITGYWSNFLPSPFKLPSKSF